MFTRSLQLAILAALIAASAGGCWKSASSPTTVVSSMNESDQPAPAPDTILRSAADAERRALRALLQEMSDLENLIREAQSYADRDARIRFDYSALQRDYRKIMSGIEAHVTGPGPRPRFIEPIAGDYRR